MSAADAPKLVDGPGRFGELHARVAVALPEALNHDHQVGPDRLRTGVAAPHAPGERRNKKERQRRQDQDAGDVVELLRPDFEAEEVETLMGEIEKHRLIGQRRPAVPSEPRQAIVDAERHDHDDPFDPAKFAVDQLRVDRLARRVERLPIFFCVDRLHIEALDARRGFLAQRCGRSRWHFVHGVLQGQGTGIESVATAHGHALFAFGSLS